MGLIDIYRDFTNFRLFKKDIKAEASDPDSLFNKFGLKTNKWGNLIYLQLNCTDRDLMNSDYDVEMMVQVKLKPIVEYLSRDLNWGDYLVPQISNFEDENGEPSLSYAIIFVFMGDNFSLTSWFLWKAFKIFILIAIIASAIVYFVK